MTTAGTYYYNRYQQQRDAADNVINTQYQGFSKTKTLLFNQAKQFHRKQRNLQTSASDRHTTINLPPRYFDTFEFARRDLKDIQLQIDETIQLIYDRIQVQFSRTDEIKEQRIKTKSQNISNQIQRLDGKLKALGKEGDENSPTDILIQRNMRVSLSSQLSEHLMLLRDAQRNYQIFIQRTAPTDPQILQQQSQPQSYDQLNQSSNSLIQRQRMQPLQQQPQFFQQNDVMKEVMQDREKRITVIAQQIKEIALVFGHMNEIVIQNGTMLDRIDANIETTKINYQKGNKQLANQGSLKGGLAQKCVCSLITLNLICMTIVILKLTVL